MLLITVREWLGNPKAYDEIPRDNLKAFVTEISLPESLIKLRKHQDAFNDWSLNLKVNYILVSVCKIDYIGRDICESMQVEHIGDLKQTAGEFEDG